MNPWLINPLLLALILLGAFSCSRSFGGTTQIIPSCETEQVGTICFQNDTRNEIGLRIGDAEANLRPATTLCLDIYAGQYEYKARQGRHKWQDEVEVLSCSSSLVSIYQ